MSYHEQYEAERAEAVERANEYAKRLKTIVEQVAQEQRQAWLVAAIAAAKADAAAVDEADNPEEYEAYIRARKKFDFTNPAINFRTGHPFSKALLAITQPTSSLNAGPSFATGSARRDNGHQHNAATESANTPKINPYDLLGLDPAAQAALATMSDQNANRTIKKAYFKMALKNHPDKNGNSEEATTKFQEIGKAFEMLKTASGRKAFEQTLKSGLGFSSPTTTPRPSAASAA
ncbi:MAG: J domain-containing protein [Gammaproteobacteria bacterium]|nr:J domain-containing protein [Gammaproteobacteria bacterium]